MEKWKFALKAVEREEEYQTGRESQVVGERKRKEKKEVRFDLSVYHKTKKEKLMLKEFAQSAGAVEYTDCSSAEG